MLKFLTAILVCSIIRLPSLIRSINIKNKEKLYSFECGFNPFNKSQTPFSIQFFKILLIFLLFDIEIIVILPLPTINNINYYTNITIIIILFLLILRLIFE